MVVSAQDLQFGIKGGINFSSLDNEGSSLDHYQSKLGFNSGLFAMIGITKKYSLKTELYYSMEGADYQDSDLYIRLNRLSLPVLINYKLGKAISIEAGPEAKFQVGFKTNLSSFQGNIKSIYENLDYGATVGLTIRPLEKVGLTVRNYFGMKYHSSYNFINESGEITSHIKTDRTNILSVSINYYLGK